MDLSDPLSQLADIHLPQQVSWWPLAPGWWLLIALLCLLAAWAMMQLFKKLRLQRRLNHALKELDKCLAELGDADAAQMAQRLDYVNNVNSVLRRVALAHFPRAGVAGLSGQAWVEFLTQHSDSSRLTPELARALTQGRFAPRCDVDTAALHAMARDWIKGVYMARIEPNTHQMHTATEHHA